MVSGSWPGEIFLFRGGEVGAFAAPEKIRHPDGKAINFGGGVDTSWGGDRFIIRGDAQWENDDKGRTVLVYEGEPIVVPEGKEGGVSGTASSVAIHDWDGDGDLDLVIGEIGGRVALARNDGTPKAWAFAKPVALEAGGAEIKVAGDAGPCVADWDGDGLADLLVGDGEGKVSLFRNAGAAKAPKLAAARVLVPKSPIRYDRPPTVPTLGHRAKVCAADWNGDGRLDLLLGDMTSLKPDRPEPTAEQKAEHDRLRAELQQVRARYRELSARCAELRKDAAKKEELEAATGEFKTAGARWTEIARALPSDSEDHGWVWLFPRLPTDAATAK